MNILITGAFGFVGTNLSNAIKNEFNPHIIAVDILEPNNHIYNEFFEWKEINKLDWNKIDSIIHLAGKAHDTKNTANEKTYFDINLGLTQQIFEYFLKSNARKFIFFSSVKAVADQVKGEQLTEEDIPNPQTAYGKSKLAAEEYILGAFQNFCQNDFLSHTERSRSVKKIYILRPCMIHGTGNKGNLNLLYRIVQKGIPWPLGNFDNKRSFISIDNLAFVINQIMGKDIEPGIYQMADDETISTNRLIRLIAESKNKKSFIWYMNRKMIHAVAKLGDIFHLPLNSERLKKLTESYVVSNKKIKYALGVERLPVTAEEGMKKTLKSFG
ncbi:MAG: NAD-dependent [Prolixibacteraceae bacterium]|nr:MAG: NAD-dependent [Prolixibacteraceae bacterium]